jgi:hypothetical protein
MSPTKVAAHGMTKKFHVTLGDVILPYYIFSFSSKLWALEVGAPSHPTYPEFQSYDFS